MTKKELCRRSCFKEVDEMGRYLGANLRFPKRRKERYRSILERVKQRLQGWKASSLSLAERITLVKSVVSPMALYTMQHDKLPQGVIEDLEKEARKFVWGEEGEERRWHAISWEMMCSPKDIGGMGILNLRKMNEALLFKVLWRMLTCPDELWVQVLFGKYGRDRDLTGKLIAKGADSRLWKELAKLWDQFITYVESNGEQENNSSISYQASSNSGQDRIKWKGAKDGKFSTKSAYQSIQSSQEGERLPEWRRIWRICVPERVKVFAWQMLHKRLPTKEITRRWDGGSGQCLVCNLQIDDQLHALRDCPFATQIWRRTIALHEREDFFGSSWISWINQNLKKQKDGGEQDNWTERFVVTCWLIWKWRNGLIHDGNFKVPPNSEEVASQIVIRCKQRCNTDLVSGRKEVCKRIQWNLPPRNWCKLNSDGWSSEDGNGGCGGVIRGDCGEWIRGFTMPLPGKDAMEAEIIGLTKGLDLCWHLGFVQVEAECDVKIIVQACLENKQITGYTHLQEKLKEVVRRNWKVQLQHVYREANRCADRIAALSASQRSKSVVWVSPPTEVEQILEEDRLGFSFLRNVKV